MFKSCLSYVFSTNISDKTFQFGTYHDLVYDMYKISLFKQICTYTYQFLALNLFLINFDTSCLYIYLH